MTTYDTNRSLWVKQSFKLHDFCLAILTYYNPQLLNIYTDMLHFDLLA